MTPLLGVVTNGNWFLMGCGSRSQDSVIVRIVTVIAHTRLFARIARYCDPKKIDILRNAPHSSWSGLHKAVNNRVMIVAVFHRTVDARILLENGIQEKHWMKE